MKVADIYVAGIGTANPGYVETATAVDQGWYDSEECERSGLLSVSVAGAAPAPDLAIEAARTALEQSGHTAADVGAVFHTNLYAQGPDGWSAQHYINRNTINRPVPSIEIRNGRLGFFASMHLATCYLYSTPDSPAALLTSADNFDIPSVNRWRASKQFVLADGGGAIVLSKRHGFAQIMAIDFACSLTGGQSANFRQRLEFFQQDPMAGDPCPSTDSTGMLVEATEKALKEAGVSMDEVARVVHDGYTRCGVRQVFLDPLGIGEDRGVWEFTRRVGHTGPLDQIRGLEYLWRSGEVGVGDTVLLLSCAPGMEAACAVVEIVRAPA